MSAWFPFFFVIILTVCSNPAGAEDNYDLSTRARAYLEKSLYYVDEGKYDLARFEARSAPDKDIMEAVLWLQFQQNYSGNNYKEIADFIKKHPTWPKLRQLRNRAELTLDSTISPQEMVAYFKDEAPITGHAMRLLAEAKMALGQKGKDIHELLRKGWIQGDFGRDKEDEYLNKHAAQLTKKDHIDRIDRLLWEDKIDAAKRLIPQVDSGHKRLFLARIQFMEALKNKDKRSVDQAVASVPSELRGDPGLAYVRIMWHKKREDYNRAFDYLKNARTTMPYQSKWWEVKNLLVREFIKGKQYGKAYQLAKDSGNVAGGDDAEDYAESEWLAGWLALRFLKQPREAYQHFYNLYHHVSYPVSLSRGAYWAARAAEANHNKDIAQGWYKKAAEHTTTFYGQMAYSKLYGKQPMKMPPFPKASAAQAQQFKNKKLLKMAYLFTLGKQYKTAEYFIIKAIENAASPEEMAFISQFGEEVGRRELSVVAAKHALRKSVVLNDTGWPVLENMPRIDIEQPLALGIIRQESHFDPTARSSADATGLMQLLPSTAKQESKKMEMIYNKIRLTSDPIYNVKIGSHYLGNLVDGFNGSYILAIASYNAGPGNVRRWLDTYGDPRDAKSPEAAIDWIERIPFSETRNYVQRVLENTQVYRSKESNTALALEKDLVRVNAELSQQLGRQGG